MYNYIIILYDLQGEIMIIIIYLM